MAAAIHHGDTGRAMGCRTTWAMAARVFAENRLAIAGVVFVVMVFLFCFLGPLLYRTNQINTDIANITQPPSPAHLLGTDNVGYDLLGRLMVGGQTSLEIGLTAAILATTFGVLWGAIAGFIGGWLDQLMMRIVDSMLAIPTLFLLLVLAAMFVPSLPMLVFIVALVAWLTPARLIRGETLSLRTRGTAYSDLTVSALILRSSSSLDATASLRLSHPACTNVARNTFAR